MIYFHPGFAGSKMALPQMVWVVAAEEGMWVVCKLSVSYAIYAVPPCNP